MSADPASKTCKIQLLERCCVSQKVPIPSARPGSFPAAAVPSPPASCRGTATVHALCRQSHRQHLQVISRAQKTANAATNFLCFFSERGGVIMSDRRRLVYSMLQFCNKELQSPDLSDDAKESLEVLTTIHRLLFSVSDPEPDPHGSALRWPLWIRIRIRIRDADSGSESSR